MRRISVLFALLAAGMCAHAQFGVSAAAHCEPKETVVGEPCAIILELDVDSRASFDNIQVYGLPERKDGSIVYGELENLADGTSARSGHVVKRMRIPVLFQKPVSFEVAPTIRGRVGVVMRGPGFSSSVYESFGCRAGTLKFTVQPLPESGRPVKFSGAVGRTFSIRQSLNRDHVRLNKEFVTVTYTLECDGYFPESNFPDIGQFPKGFKVYPPKGGERNTDNGITRVTWTQDLIPLTAQATNTASVSINYYNPQTKRYEVAHADPLPLAFVSAEADSSVNARVAVTGLATTQKTSAGKGDGVTTQALVLHFAPSEDSPAVVTIEAGTPVKELATWNGWRRLEAPNAIGWTRSN